MAGGMLPWIKGGFNVVKMRAGLVGVLIGLGFVRIFAQWSGPHGPSTLLVWYDLS